MFIFAWLGVYMSLAFLLYLSFGINRIASMTKMSHCLLFIAAFLNKRFLSNIRIRRVIPACFLFLFVP